jgi:hypothetical protein
LISMLSPISSRLAAMAVIEVRVLSSLRPIFESGHQKLLDTGSPIQVPAKLFREIQALGFKGSYQGVARFLSPWRESGPTSKDMEAADERPGTECATPSEPAPREIPAPVAPLPRDPFNGCRISPVVAAALCIKPSGMLTERQAARVHVLKRE